MTSLDKTLLTVITMISLAVIVVGGVFHPSTIAGTIAKFFFSLN
jgi:hypothetical protein